MRYIALLLLAGCVSKERRPPEFRYDTTESDSYDCPHAPAELQLHERCKAAMSRDTLGP